MSSRFNGNPEPYYVRVTARNVDEFIGYQVMYFTKGMWEISKLESVADTKFSILISNGDYIENTTHKKRLNIPTLSRDGSIERPGRCVYAIE